MTLMDYWEALIVVPSSQQQCVTVLQKLAYSVSIGMLLQDEAIAPPLVIESKDPNDNETGMTSGDNKHRSIDVIKDTLQFSVSKTRHRMTRNNLLQRYFLCLGKQNNPYRPYPS
jgi:hypothetical protein